jgi:outer membrane immunogenic protein
MERFSYGICTALTAIVIAAPALAGGPTTVEPEAPVAVAPAMPSVTDWSGFYGGLAFGIPSGDNTFSEREGPSSALAGDWDGTLTYLTGGYDWQSGSFVYGAALDIGIGSIDAAGTEGPDFDCGTSCYIEVDNYVALRGRVGYAMESALLYGTVGYAMADATADFGDGVVAGSDSLSGWAAGVGVEFMVSDRFSIDVSYINNDLGTLEIPDDCDTDCYSDVEFGQLKLGANYRW